MSLVRPLGLSRCGFWAGSNNPENPVLGSDAGGQNLAFRHRGWLAGRIIDPTSVLAFAAILLALAAPTQAAFPGANGKITFVRVIHNDQDIWSVNPDGSGLTQLTHDTTDSNSAAWSPDGLTIAFYSNRSPPGIYLMDADGSNERFLAPGSDPTWSPDGTKLAFEPFGGGIATMNSDGTGQTVLTTTTDHRGPVWSPDGVEIAFYTFQPFRVWKMNADGSNVTQLTDANHVSGYPSWSPDSTKLVFDSRPVNSPGTGDIWVMNRDGSDKMQLTRTTQLEATPAWSPDGEKIVYWKTDGQQHFATMNTDGSDQAPLVYNLYDTIDIPDWQPILTPQPGYARPKAATPTTIALVPAHEACTSANSTHGSPLALPSCNPPQQASDHLTVGSPGSNGAAPNSVGSVKLRVACIPPAPNPAPLCTSPGEQATSRSRHPSRTSGTETISPTTPVSCGSRSRPG